MPGQPSPGQTGPSFSLAGAVNASLLTVLGLAAIAAVLLLLAVVVRHRTGRRQREMQGLLDAADALEARLRTARS